MQKNRLQRGSSAILWQERAVNINRSEMSKVKDRLREDFPIGDDHDKVRVLRLEPVVKSFPFQTFFRVESGGCLDNLFIKICRVFRRPT
jgi:hypothetical protein